MVEVIVAALFLGLGVAAAQASSMTDQVSDLEKKYGPILGEYEFNMTEGSFYLNFYIEEGELWADSGDGRPATMVPEEGGEFKFKADDPQTGTFLFEFLKDGRGEYTICRLIHEEMGIDAQGTKIR